MLLLKTHHSQPNGPIKTKGCHAKLKCQIWMDNYKYDTNEVILCI
jgi:hypothetical protein